MDHHRGGRGRGRISPLRATQADRGVSHGAPGGRVLERDRRVRPGFRAGLVGRRSHRAIGHAGPRRRQPAATQPSEQPAVVGRDRAGGAVRTAPRRGRGHVGTWLAAAVCARADGFTHRHVGHGRVGGLGVARSPPVTARSVGADRLASGLRADVAGRVCVRARHGPHHWRRGPPLAGWRWRHLQLALCDLVQHARDDRARTLAGVGFGEFNLAWTLSEFPSRPTAFFDHTHNLPLQLLVGAGRSAGFAGLCVADGRTVSGVAPGLELRRRSRRRQASRVHDGA